MSRERTRLPNGAIRVTRDESIVAALVWIDQQPLRRAAAADCNAAMAELERARAGWHQFEHKDKPAFARWRAREFGPLLSRAREVEVQIREHQALIDEVEIEMRRLFQDPHTAYQRVMFRRADPVAAAEQEAARARSGGSDATRKVSEFEQEALFQEWVQRSLGTNPDKMDDEAYSTSFEAFKTHMFRSAPAEPQRHNTSRGPEQQRPRDDSDSDEAPEEHDEPDARVKELYRTLVRRLHPDLRADGSAAVSALWHEVQEAYAASDVARMEILLALCEIGANPMSDETTLSQMRSVFAELTRALGALEMSLEEAEREDAWDFARVGATDQLRARVERELKSELATRTLRLNVLARTIADWAQPAATNRQVAAVRRFAY